MTSSTQNNDCLLTFNGDQLNVQDINKQQIDDENRDVDQVQLIDSSIVMNNTKKIIIDDCIESHSNQRFNADHLR